jgi:chromosome segregation ATPase
MNTLEIRDLGPIKSMSLDMTGPVVLLHGPHGSGKSTVANALTLALYGETSRLRLKRDLYQMIRAGADKAQITYRTADRVLTRTIGEKSTRGTRAKASELDKIRMEYPWVALTQKPSVWKTMLGSVGLPKENLQVILKDLPIAHEALERAADTLEGTIANLEDWRLELHRAKAVTIEVEATTRIGGAEVDISEYAPHVQHYMGRRDEIQAEIEAVNSAHRARLHEHQTAVNALRATEDAWQAFAERHGLDTGAPDRVAAAKQVYQNQITEIVQTKTALEDIDTQIAGMSAVCEACGQGLPSPELHALVAKGKCKRDGIKIMESMLVGIQRVIDTVGYATAMPPAPEPPDTSSQEKESASITELVSAIGRYNWSLEQHARAEKEAEKAKTTHKQVQTAIERLRDPGIAEKLAGNSSMDKVRSILKHSCEILGLPPVVLSEGLVPLLSLPDGTLRDVNLLSDTQRALAGLALSEAFARVQGAPFMIVDQIDWVHGEHVGLLRNYLSGIAAHYETLLVLTSSDDVKIEISLSMRGMCYSLEAGSVRMSFPIKPDPNEIPANA